VEAPPEPQANPADTVVIVSGLPRSGTSMVMQMLVAGGVQILSDGLRAADDDNPLGYFEDERVKHLHANADWLKGARGRAIKVVAPLLPYLPNDQNYRIVFNERNVDEVLASQVQMMARRGEKVADSPTRRARLKKAYARQVDSLTTTLARCRVRGCSSSIAPTSSATPKRRPRRSAASSAPASARGRWRRK